MWARLLFCFLVAAASAERGWKASQQYEYDVRGLTLVSLHDVTDQYDGVHLKAKLQVQAEDDDTLNIRVLQAQQADVHQRLLSGWSSLDESTLSYHPLNLVEEPFQVKLRNGVVKKLIVSAKVPLPQVNLIKSLVSQLQLDTKGENRPQESDGQVPSEEDVNGVYDVVEDTVSGKCHVEYAVSEMPMYIVQSHPEVVPMPQLVADGKVINIVKVSNFSNCKNLPEYHFGLDGLHAWKPASAKMGQFFARSSLSRVVLSGSMSRYTIQSSSTTNKAIMSPALYNSQKGMVVSNMKLTLAGVQPAQGALQRPADSVHYKDLVYSYEPASTTNPTSSVDGSGYVPYLPERGQPERKTRMIHNEADEENSVEVAPNAGDSAAARKFRQSLKKSQEERSEDTSAEVTATLPEADQSVAILLHPEFAGSQTMDRQRARSLTSQYAKQIGEELQKPETIPSKATLAKFTVLSALVRSLNQTEMRQLTTELYAKTSENQKTPAQIAAWKTYRDAVAEAGTSPALLTIREWIFEDLVKEQEAAELLATLPRAARLPSRKYLHTLFELVNSQKVKQQQELNATAALSFADLVRLAQVDSQSAHNRYPTHIFGRLNPKESQPVTRDYIPYFKTALKKAVQNKDSKRIQIYIRVLGNMAHPKIVEVFEPYLSGQVRVTKFQRLAMVMAMNQLAKTHPRIARAALLRLYQNVADAPQVRAAAVIVLMKTNPSANVLQRMAESTKDEHNPHIRAVFKSAIESAAHLKSWDSWELTSHGKAAQPMLNTSETNARLSQLLLKSYDVQDMPLAYRASLATIGSQGDFLPQAAFLSLRQNLGELKLNAEGVGIMTSSINDIVRAIANQFDESKPSFERNATPFRASYGWTIQDILSELNITRDHSEPIEANMLVQTLAGKRFFAMDNQTLQQLPYDFQKTMEELRQGKSFNYTKLFNQYTVSMSFPTATGLPFFYSLSTPTLLQLGGKTRIVMQPQPTAQKIAIPETLNATFDIHAVASSKIQAEMGFIDPMTLNRYTAGVERDMQVNLPIQAQINVGLEKKNEESKLFEIRAKIRPTETEEDFQIATLRSRPFTAKQNMQQPGPLDQHIIHVRKPYEANFTIGQDLTGMAFRVDAATEHKFADFAFLYEKTKKHDVISALTFFFNNDVITNYEINLGFDHQKSTAKAATFTVAVESSSRKEFDEKDRYPKTAESEPQRSQQMPALMTSNLQHRLSSETVAEAAQATLSRPSSNPAKPSDTSANSRDRRRQFLKKTSEHINDADAIAIDLSATFKGKTKAEFIATAAMAASEVSDDHRTLVYLRKKSADQRESQLAMASEAKIPRVPLANFLNAVKTQPDILVKSIIDFGEQIDSSASQVAVVARLHRTKGQLEHIRRSPMGKLCVEQMHKGDNYLPACQNATISVSKLNAYDVNIAYDRVSEKVQNMTYKAYSVARDFGWQFVSESVIGVNNGEKKIALKARFERDYEAVNVSIAAPTFNSHFENVRLDRNVAAAVVAQPTFGPVMMAARELLQNEAFPICTVAQTAVNTFSNKTFPINLDKNWHVVFASAYKKDSPTEKYNDLVVLTRETTSSEHQKELVILAGPNVIELTYARDFARVNVNGNTIKVSDSRTNTFSDGRHNTWALIYGRPDGTVKVVLPQFAAKVLYDRTSVVVNAGSQYREQIRGLCGLFNGEEASDFTAPRNCVLKEPKDFSSSYVVRPTGAAANDQENAKNAKCISRQYTFGNLYVADSYEEQDEASSSGCVNYKVKIVEHEGKTCFSKRPQPTCNSHCQPSSEVEKHVDFACVSDRDVVAQWQKQIKSSVVPSELAGFPSSKSLSMRIPESCQP